MMNNRIIPDSECKQGKCGATTTGCVGKCALEYGTLHVETYGPTSRFVNRISELEQQLTAEREAREKAEVLLHTALGSETIWKQRAEKAEFTLEQTQDCLLHERNRLADTFAKLEAAEQRNREAMEQDPDFFRWYDKERNIVMVTSWIPTPQQAIDGYKPLYAAPIPPADVAELQRELLIRMNDREAAKQRAGNLERENAELTRKLAEQQALAEALDDALDKFGEHKDGCTFAEPLPTGIGTWGCNCGLDNAKFGISGREELTKLLEEAKRQAVPEELHKVLVAVFREIEFKEDYNDGNAPGHAHSTPGVWDDDNGDLSGTECAWCNLWNTAKQMLSAAPQSDGIQKAVYGNQKWPNVDKPEGVNK